MLERVRKAMTMGIGGDVEDQQRRRDREDPVRERLEPRRRHRTSVRPGPDNFSAASAVTFSEMNARCRSCLACGEELPEPLVLAGSLRCQSCRDADEPLDPELCVPADEREAA